MTAVAVNTTLTPLPLNNYRMSERSLHDDFGIRNECSALPNLGPHRHEYFQIHVQVSGQTEHWIGHVRRPVTAGTVCFILPFQTHYIPTAPESRYFIINASKSYLLPSLEVDLQDLAQTPIDRAPELAPFLFQQHIDFVLPSDELRLVIALSQAMAEEDGQRATGATILIRGYLLQLIGLVWRRYGDALMHWSAMSVTTANRHPALIRLNSYLKNRLHASVSLAEAAAAIHLSPTYLAHLIKRESGQTFVESITQRRMELAQELLQHTALSVKEIAFRCGYADEAYFSKRFRVFAGVSPSAKRAQLQSASAI